MVDAAARDSEQPALFLGPASFRELIEARFPGVRYVTVSRARRFAEIGTVRRLAPASALLLTDSLSSAIVAALAGIPERVGYGAEARGALLTRRVPRSSPARSAPRVEEYRTLGRAAGLHVEEALPRLHALDVERKRARALLDSAGVSREGYAVVAPGANYGPAKRWDPGNFAKVASALHARGGIPSLLVGTKEDAAPAREVARLAGGAVHDLTGATDLASLTGLLDGARIVASNDSGVMHLAAALGKPTLAVFGSTSPAWSAAQAPWVRSLYAAYPCSPCFRRTCPIGYGCLKSIDASHAVGAALEMAATAR